VAQEVHVSYHGMSQYVGMCRDQERFLEKVEDLVNGSCANFGAFTGFMALFAGAYEDAQRTVASQVRNAVTGANQLGENIADTRADFRATDDGVTTDLDGVRVDVGCAPTPTIGSGGDGPGMPPPIKTTNAGMDALRNAETMAPHLPQHLSDGLPGRTPPLVDAGIRGLPTDGVEIVTQTLDTVAAGQSISQAQDDEETYEEFEHMHRRLGGGGHR
jgi:hypothetical protein